VSWRVLPFHPHKDKVFGLSFFISFTASGVAILNEKELRYFGE
jgi:hypothetical protein